MRSKHSNVCGIGLDRRFPPIRPSTTPLLHSTSLGDPCIQNKNPQFSLTLHLPTRSPPFRALANPSTRNLSQNLLHTHGHKLQILSQWHSHSHPPPTNLRSRPRSLQNPSTFLSPTHPQNPALCPSRFLDTSQSSFGTGSNRLRASGRGIRRERRLSGF